MKDRVTLTIDQHLLRQIDASVDGRHIKNRSHAVELLLMQALKGDMAEQAILLAGGSKQRVKSMLAKLHEKPILQHNIELLAKYGVQNIIIISVDTGLLRETFGNGEQFGVQLTYVQESIALGTAGALRLAQPYVQGTFIVMNGDEFKDINVKDMYTFHRQHGGQCTLALTTTGNPEHYGVALLNGNRIITFVEKPEREHAPSNLISAGFYVMEPTIFALIPEGYARFETDMFPKLAREDQLYGYIFAGKYVDKIE